MQNEETPLYIEKKFPSFESLKAGRTFRENELLIDLKAAVEQLDPDYTTIDLGDKHVFHPIARYVNHSCDPTAYVDQTLPGIVAHKTLHRGDEITFNYLISERQIIAPFDCLCGASNCVGRVDK